LKFSNGTSHGRHGESVRVLAQNLNTLFQMYDMTAKQLFDQFIDVFGRSYRWVCDVTLDYVTGLR